MSVQPSAFRAWMLARKFKPDGGIGCPRPWRGRNTSFTPPSVPVSSWSEGEPQGVSTLTQRLSSSPSISYSPEPPMTPSIQSDMSFPLKRKARLASEPFRNHRRCNPPQWATLRHTRL